MISFINCFFDFGIGVIGYLVQPMMSVLLPVGFVLFVMFAAFRLIGSLGG